MDRQAARDELLSRWRDIALLSTSTAVLEWDEETAMPSAAAGWRGEQLALLAGLAHDRYVDPRLWELIEELDAHGAGGVDDETRAQARAARHVVERHRRLPRALVGEEQRAAVEAQQAWIEARKQRSFALFRPSLERVVELQRDISRCLTDEGRDPWEALLREHEPGASADDVVDLLRQLASALRPRLQAATAAQSAQRSRPARKTVLDAQLDASAQQRVVSTLIALCGFERERGGVGHNVHPFCATLGPDDVRISLRRLDVERLGNLVGYTVHELGHALYELGIPRPLVGTPAGELRSLSLHESQSRLWENQVAKAPSLWRHLLPRITRELGELGGTAAGAGGAVDDVVASLHRVEPGLIRVGADQTTYNLHVVVRVELERALIGGQLAVRDLPEAWNGAYEEQLGIRPADDLEGCLQDGHWASAMFGYFPTYTIGNLIAAQLFHAARRDIDGAAGAGALDDAFARGDVSALKRWLAERVHRRAGLASAAQIVLDATGAPLSPAPFLAELDAAARYRDAPT